MGRMNIGTRIFTWLRGRQVGRDAVGNIYYEDNRAAGSGLPRRWVAFAGASEASVVPPEWHGWLHHTTDAPLPAPDRPWIKPHMANMTGTPLGYRPPGHDYMGGQRAPATGDYQAWTPDGVEELPPERQLAAPETWTAGGAPAGGPAALPSPKG